MLPLYPTETSDDTITLTDKVRTSGVPPVKATRAVPFAKFAAQFPAWAYSAMSDAVCVVRRFTAIK